MEEMMHSEKEIAVKEPDDYFSYMLLKTRAGPGGDLNAIIEDISCEFVEYSTNVPKKRLTKVNVKYKNGIAFSCFLHPDYADYVYVRERDSIFNIRTGMKIRTTLSMKIPLRFVSIERSPTKVQEFVGVDRFVADIFLDRRNTTIQAESIGKKIYIEHKHTYLCCDPDQLEIKIETGKEITALKKRWEKFKKQYGTMYKTQIKAFTKDTAHQPKIYQAWQLSNYLGIPTEHIHYVVLHKHRLHSFSFIKNAYEDVFLTY